jgi:CRISPR-associated protein Cmr2
MDDNFWKLKIKAYLHDPPEKAIILGSGERHEDVTAVYGKTLTGDDIKPSEVTSADHIAAATTRPVLEKSLPDGGMVKPAVTWVNQPVLINPLSGEQYDLKTAGGELKKWDLFDTTVDMIKKYSGEAAGDEIARIKKDFGGDLKKMYFVLWRLLAGRLVENTLGEGEKARLGNLWRHLPADTRVPDHSIWDHASMTAALAGALPRPAFLLFSIGPVQGFISTARRTQDLWMGSYLLSYLTWSAIKTVVDEYGPDTIIFPGLEGQPLFDRWLTKEMGIDTGASQKGSLSIASFPNRFLALLPEDKAPEAGAKCVMAVNNTWDAICENIKAYIEGRHDSSLKSDNLWNGLWKNQAKSYFETYWAALPWTPDGKTGVQDADCAEALIERFKELVGAGDNFNNFKALYDEFKKNKSNYINAGTCYELLYDLVERAHGARKAARNFPPKEEAGYKCTLCGEREALHSSVGAASHEQAIRQFWETLAKKVGGSHFKYDGGERLCSICTVKRLAVHYFRDKLDNNFGEVFPSVSSIAVAPFQIGLLEKAKTDAKTKQAIRDYVSAMKTIDTNNMLFHAGCVEKAWRIRKHPTLGTVAEDFLRIDGDYLFKDSFNNIKNDLGIAAVHGDVNTAKQKLSDLLDLARELDPPLVPSAYVAVLHMDGDDMGKWLSGEKAPLVCEVIHPHIKNEVEKHVLSPALVKNRRPMSPALHSAVSNALRDYAIGFVRMVVEDWHAGQLIFAGGDDVLALLPKSEAVAAANDLRLVYSGITGIAKDNIKSGGGFIYNGSQNKLYRMMGQTATLSGGIAITHHSHSLQDAVRRAHALEEQAKGWPPWEKTAKRKNAVTLAASTRSGETRQACLPFRETDGKSAVEILEAFRVEFSQGALSPTVITALYQEADGLSALPTGTGSHLEKRLAYLVKRNIIWDKNKVPAPEEKAGEIVDNLLSMVKLYAGNSYAGQRRPGQPYNALESALAVLRLSLFLAREERS